MTKKRKSKKIDEPLKVQVVYGKGEFDLPDDVCRILARGFLKKAKEMMIEQGLLTQ